MRSQGLLLTRTLFEALVGRDGDWAMWRATATWAWNAAAAQGEVLALLRLARARTRGCSLLGLVADSEAARRLWCQVWSHYTLAITVIQTVTVTVTVSLTVTVIVTLDCGVR